MKKVVATILLSALVFVGCKSNEEKETFTQKTEKAHQKEKFATKQAIQFDFKLEFGGKERMDAKFIVLTNSTQGIIEYKNGAKIIFDKDKVYYSANIPSEETVRFDAFTWEYFFLFPYKLTDPGTIWNAYDNKEANHEEYLTEKLTFKSGTGEAPDDWYVVYADKKTNLIEKAAYIVTIKGNKEEAEKNPHAIQYLEYKDVDGIPIATKWVFWEWKEGEGLTNNIGNASLTNIKFITVTKDTFKIDPSFKTK
ncbi:DUF6503 family protein [Flavobacterium degerlachei]|jgi:hypothetical protein|uniref:Uncharacterized protein n=1 Tax=Flavobacterium degerlachei TaxID=229203 RepID=A0A1H2ZGM6_9FLAO|nr:DUF6503 family protein [Flavobacterium degerlachei]SDX16600.1 hypothetical protein SAMN05444338_107189 [Flavobacterium degerlachei]